MAVEHPYLSQARRDLEKAESARSKAEAMLREAEQNSVRLKNFIEQYEYYMSIYEQDNGQAKHKVRTRSLTDTAVSIIEMAEEPLSIQEILVRIQSYGIEVGGENKAANLAAYLSKDNRVQHLKGFGWVLSSAENFSAKAGVGGDGHSTVNSVQASFNRGRVAELRSQEAARAASRTRAVDVDDDIQF